MAVGVYFVILLLTECIFYTFHLSILLLLIVKRKNKFEGAFYDIFRIVLVADFISFINSLIVQRISLIPHLSDFYENSTFFASFMTLLTPFILFIQFFGRLLMAFNRFTTIWFPLNHQKIWEKQWYTVFLIVFSFLTICWRFDERFRYIYLSNGRILIVQDNADSHPIIKGISFIIYFFATIVAAIFNGLSFAKFFYNKRKSASYRLNEQHLLFMSIIILVAQLGRASYTLSQYLFPMDENVIAIFVSILPYLNDALALSGSLSFFLLSKTARKEYKAFYLNKKLNTVEVKI